MSNRLGCTRSKLLETVVEGVFGRVKDSRIRA